MKCDRYIGTGASNTQKEVRSKSIACTSRSSTLHPLDSVNSGMNRFCKKSLTETVYTDSRKGSLQVPSINGRRSTVDTSSTRSSVLIPDVLSDLRKFNGTDDTLVKNCNRCIVIELHELKDNATEINERGIDQGKADHAKLSTSIKDYKVNKICLITFCHIYRFMKYS